MEIVVLSILAALVIIGISTNWLRVYKRKLDLDEATLIMRFNYTRSKDNIIMFLNDFIIDCLQDYIMYNITPDSGLTYITKERENIIRNDLKIIVSSRLSPFILKKILMCYSQDHVNQIIAEKIFSAVTVYVAEFNSSSNKIVEINRGTKKTPTDLNNDW